MKYFVVLLVTAMSVFMAGLTLSPEWCGRFKLLKSIPMEENKTHKEIRRFYKIVISAAVLLLSASALLSLANDIDETVNMVKMSVSIVCLTGVACYDYREYRIPNVFPAVMAIFGIVCLGAGYISFQESAMMYVFSSLFATIAVALCMTLASILTKHGIGMGDIKLLCALALLDGVYAICGTLFFSMILCSAAAIILLITKKRTIKGSVPFGPFIYMGFMISVLLKIY